MNHKEMIKIIKNTLGEDVLSCSTCLLEVNRYNKQAYCMHMKKEEPKIAREEFLK